MNEVLEIEILKELLSDYRNHIITTCKNRMKHIDLTEIIKIVDKSIRIISINL